DADAQHREDLARASLEHQAASEKLTTQLLGLMHQNTELTRLTTELAERVQKLTTEIHGQMIKET
ncbi:MAG: hypothetical protein JWM16_2292, partial [Verrucomicrobiales bacterium]|nr:hypothetical protein [Verrucomicrobiales bacterium]